MTTTTTRQTAKACELRTGQHIATGYDADHDIALHVEEVRHVEPYTRPDGKPYVLIVIEGADFYRCPADELIPLGNDDEIRETTRHKRRAEIVAGLRELADLIEERKLPVPTYRALVSWCAESRDQVERWAEVGDVLVRMGGTDGDIPVADWMCGAVEVHVQGPPEPKTGASEAPGTQTTTTPDGE